MSKSSKDNKHEQVRPRELASALDKLRAVAGIKDPELGVLHGAHDDRNAIVRIAANFLRRKKTVPKGTKRKTQPMPSPR